MSTRRVRKAVIPIAGLGSRFLPATKCIPKEILPVYDRPVIELIVRELAKAGVEKLFCCSSRRKCDSKSFLCE